MKAMDALFQRAFWTWSESRARSYHLRLKPCQSVRLRFVALNDSTTTTTIGRYRNR